MRGRLANDRAAVARARHLRLVGAPDAPECPEPFQGVPWPVLLRQHAEREAEQRRDRLRLIGAFALAFVLAVLIVTCR